MAASNQIFLVMDAGSSMTAFTSQRRLDTFTNPLVYTFCDEGYSPIIMTMSRALAE